MQSAEPVAANMIVHVGDALERGPGRVNDEGGESEKNCERLKPPRIGAGRFREASLLRQGISVKHNVGNSSY